MESDAVMEQIRDRAYEISQSDEAGTPEENWVRAERDVRGRELALRGAVELARDDGWSDLDDEEHAALEAVHRRGVFA